MVRSVWHIYVDESGDLGLSPDRSTRHLVIAAMATPDNEILSRIPKRTRNMMGTRTRCPGEFKFCASSDRIRYHILEEVRRIRPVISWNAIDKRTTYRSEGELDAGIYKGLCRAALSGLVEHVTGDNVDVAFDRRTERWFKEWDVDPMVASLFDRAGGGRSPMRIQVHRYDSRGSSGLQVHDFVAGAVFQRVERGVGSYYSVIADLVVNGVIGAARKMVQPPDGVFDGAPFRSPLYRRDLPADRH